MNRQFLQKRIRERTEMLCNAMARDGRVQLTAQDPVHPTLRRRMQQKAHSCEILAYRKESWEVKSMVVFIAL